MGGHPDLQYVLDHCPMEQQGGSQDAEQVVETQAKNSRDDEYARSFRLENVEIKTVSGSSLWTRMWVSDEEPRGISQRVVERFKCEECGKEFDKRQKVLLHARFHGKSG